MFVYSYVNAWTCEATPVSHEAAAHKAINLLGVPPSKRAPKKRRYWSSTKESGVTMILQMCVELVTDKCLRRGDSVLSLAVVVRGQARAVFTVEGCDRQQGAFCMWPGPELTKSFDLPFLSKDISDMSAIVQKNVEGKF